MVITSDSRDFENGKGIIVDWLYFRLDGSSRGVCIETETDAEKPVVCIGGAHFYINAFVAARSQARANMVSIMADYS